MIDRYDEKSAKLLFCIGIGSVLQEMKGHSALLLYNLTRAVRWLAPIAPDLPTRASLNVLR